MSGFQDEKSAGGGAVEKKKEAKIGRPDPGAVAATVKAQIAAAKQAAADAKKSSKANLAAKKEQHIGSAIEKIGDAHNARWDAVDEAETPVLDQQGVISDLERQLRQAKIDLVAKKAVFSAKKGELKTAYKTAVAGIKEAASSEISNAKSAHEAAVQTAQQELGQAIATGADIVAKEKALADLHDNWHSQMKWEGRKAGFNAVAATVKAIVAAVQTTYRENRDLARANVEVPAELLEYHNKKNGGPTPPAAS